MTNGRDRVLHVGNLARVEGEGSLHVRVRNGRVEEARLDIYEAPRFFEAFLRGRAHTEPPDITARVCGICPVAYQTSSCLAVEDACGVTVDAPVTALRRLLYCGEWIESHALHVHLLHAPDFLGYDGAVEMARHHRDAVTRGLALKKAGNEILRVLGGRPIHPVNMRVGGFHRAPTVQELQSLVRTLREALDLAVEAATWVGAFEFPDVTHDHAYLALDDPDGRYPIDRGTPTVGVPAVNASDGGAALGEREPFPLAAFEQRITEYQVPHSTALHARLAGHPTYLTGPLARYALFGDRLSPLARELAANGGLGPVCRNPFRSIVVRAVEVVYAVEEALRLIGDYRPPDPAFRPVAPRDGVGHGASEAPRGLLYHRYALAADGSITAARIVPPTAQNQAAIEADLRSLVEARLDQEVSDLTGACERAIRNHDPCISCATHFLDLTLQTDHGDADHR